MTRRMRRQSAGFTLMDMLVALALLAVVGVMFSEVFMLCATVTKEARFAEEGFARWDQAVQQLRQDMWRSRSVALVDPLMIEIELSDGQWVRWTRKHDPNAPGDTSVLIRSIIQGGDTLEAIDVTEYRHLGWYGEFDVRGNDLVLHSSPIGFRPEMEMTLVSQLRYAGDVTPPPDDGSNEEEALP